MSEITAAERAAAADRGEAMPDGSYPTRNTRELRDAFTAYGRETPDKRPELRRYLVRRAVRLGRPDLIPDTWKIRTRRRGA